jgi:hypothetical protein
MTQLISRRTFAKLSVLSGAPLVVAAAEEEKLQSEFLLRLVLEAQPPNIVGNRVIVPVSGGTFEGPKLKGTSSRQAATGSTSVLMDRASSTSACCCRPMTPRRST